MTKKSQLSQNQASTVTICMPVFTELNKNIGTLIDLLKGSNNPKEKTILSKKVLDMLTVCQNSLQKYDSNGRITGSKMGSKIYYRREDLDKFIENNK